jgi:catechol 2,3-dioxygenase-like lactoylglutathione lyase family enzyme
MQHDHLAFMTSDSKATHDFYVDVIGWPLVVAWGDAEFSPPFFITGYDAGHFKLEFEEQVGVAPAAPAAEPFPHFGMLVSNEDEIEGWRARLKAKGVRYVDHGSEIWFSDPNGIRFQVFYKDGAGDTPEDILERSKANLAEWLARPRK